MSFTFEGYILPLSSENSIKFFQGNGKIGSLQGWIYRYILFPSRKLQIIMKICFIEVWVQLYKGH